MRQLPSAEVIKYQPSVPRRSALLARSHARLRKSKAIICRGPSRRAGPRDKVPMRWGGKRSLLFFSSSVCYSCLLRVSPGEFFLHVASPRVGTEITGENAAVGGSRFTRRKLISVVEALLHKTGRERERREMRRNPSLSLSSCRFLSDTVTSWAMAASDLERDQQTFLLGSWREGGDE